MLAAVAGMGAALREPELLQLVDHRHHRAGVDQRAIDELPLVAAGVGGDQGEDAEVGRTEAERLERGSELVGRALAVPGEQEAGGAGQRLGWGDVEAHCENYPTATGSFVIETVLSSNDLQSISRGGSRLVLDHTLGPRPQAHRRESSGLWPPSRACMAAGPASDALEPEFSVPGKEGWETNVAIAQRYQGTGGDTAPLLPVVTLPKGESVDSPGVRADLSQVDARLQKALPNSRLASYASTGDRTFVSDDGRTVFGVVYPQPDPDSAFGENPKAEKAASAALEGATVGGAPVHLTGFDALAEDSGADDDGPGVLLEAVLGGVGALIVLSFVFASFLAVVPIGMAVVSIMTTFLLLLGLTELTNVSPIVQFLIALIGLGVSIDYSLLVVSRWREERSHGRSGDEAVQRAMETAGRAVVFSGITVAIGLLALIALPLPFLRSMGYGGMLIPLVATLVAITLLPVVMAKLGPRLDWPHRRTDDKASRAWTRWAEAVARRRWVAAGAGMAVVLALVVAATDLQLGTSDANTIAKSGDAKQGLVALEDAGIGEGSLLPHEILIEGGTNPEQVAADLRKVEGIHGAVAPRQHRVASRRHGARRGDPDSGQRLTRRARLRWRGSAARRTLPVLMSASVASRRQTTTSSTPSTAASR